MKLKDGHWYISRDGATLTQVHKIKDGKIYARYEFRNGRGNTWTIQGEAFIGTEKSQDLVAEMKPPKRVEKKKKRTLPKKDWVLLGALDVTEYSTGHRSVFSFYRTPKGNIKTIEEDVRD